MLCLVFFFDLFYLWHQSVHTNTSLACCLCQLPLGGRLINFSLLVHRHLNCHSIIYQNALSLLSHHDLSKCSISNVTPWFLKSTLFPRRFCKLKVKEPFGCIGEPIKSSMPFTSTPPGPKRGLVRTDSVAITFASILVTLVRVNQHSGYMVTVRF